MKISGNFDVDLAPMASHAQGQDGNNLARMTIDKKFHGPLQATSQGEMLSAMTSTQGSAGYVAIEQVIGTLEGQRGSFVLQHFGIVDKGQDYLKLQVVPDSGTGELAGLVGTMDITNDNDQHQYHFDFEFSKVT